MAYLHFQESLRGRIAVNGMRSVFATIAPSGIKSGLGICAVFSLMGVLGVFANWQRNGVLNLRLLVLIAILSFCLGWIVGVVWNLVGRSLIFFGDRGITLNEGSTVLNRWQPQEVASLEVIDGPKDRLVFDIEFVDSDRYAPLQFVTTCDTDRRAELEQGLELFSVAQSGTSDDTTQQESEWSTKEADLAVSFRYLVIRFFSWLGILNAVGSGLMAILFLTIGIASGKPIILGVAGFMAFMLLVSVFWVSRTRIALKYLEKPYQEAMARSRAEEQ